MTDRSSSSSSSARCSPPHLPSLSPFLWPHLNPKRSLTEIVFGASWAMTCRPLSLFTVATSFLAGATDDDALGRTDKTDDAVFLPRGRGGGLSALRASSTSATAGGGRGEREVRTRLSPSSVEETPASKGEGSRAARSMSTPERPPALTRVWAAAAAEEAAAEVGRVAR